MISIDELAIGDLIMTSGNWKEKVANKICVVTGLRDENYLIRAVIVGGKQRVWSDNEADFSPVPLTREILAGNGFEIQEQGGNRTDMWTGFGEDNRHDIEVEFDGERPVHLKIDGPVYLATSEVRHLHQLQHFLRECGTGIGITIEGMPEMTAEEPPMTYGDLKEALNNPSLHHDIMILAGDPTLGTTRKDQMAGMLFRYITGKTWCDTDDNEMIKQV